ncbi:MAG TPA: cytochrome D1 domain-containing protein [Vicinamibacterales bacterium]|nr:cytochrome D1 domain-containing protein [Vicinamibacterales bacterium]
MLSCAAATPAGDRVFVSNETSGTVSVVDVASRRVVQTIHVGKRPRGIRATTDGRTVYVALSGSPIGGPNVDESTLPPPDRRYDGIGVIDVASGSLTRTLKSGTDPEQFAISADGSRLFIANEDAGLASVLDVATGEIIKEIEVGGEPEGVDLSPDGRLVFVTSEEDNQVVAIDTSSLSAIKAIAVGPRPRSTAFTSSPPRAYVGSENGASVDVIDLASLTVLTRIRFPVETARPMGLASSPDGAQVFVSTGRGGTVEAIDTRTNTVRGSVAVGQRPWGIAVSPDGTSLFTANGPSNDLSVVDIGTFREIARIPVGERPWGVAYVRATSR